MRFMPQNLRPPSRSNGGTHHEDGRGNTHGSHTQKAKPPVLIGMCGDKLQIKPRKTEKETNPDEPLPAADTEQELVEQLAHQRVIPARWRQMEGGSHVAKRP